MDTNDCKHVEQCRWVQTAYADGRLAGYGELVGEVERLKRALEQISEIPYNSDNPDIILGWAKRIATVALAGKEEG